MKQHVKLVCTYAAERVPFTPLCHYDGVYTEGLFMRILVRRNDGRCERVDIHAPKVGHVYRLTVFCGKELIGTTEDHQSIWKDVFGEAVLEVIEVTDAP